MDRGSGAPPPRDRDEMGRVHRVGVDLQRHSWREGDGFVGVLSKPFPLRDAWNDLSGQPSAELIDANLEEYERQLAVFEKFYWDPARVNGAFPICTLGCALRILLVVSGEQAGHLWLDRRADDNGISPLISNNNLRSDLFGLVSGMAR